MKKSLRLFAAFLALCITVGVVPPAHGAAAEAASSYFDLFEAVENASDGAVISLTQDAQVNAASDGSDVPWIIHKNLTIEGNGHSILIRRGGILLDGDVTFQNVGLDFTNNLRNAIIANGHTLTLDSVKASNVSFNVICGTLIPSPHETFAVPAPGPAAEVHILGKTNLQSKPTWGSGNIYAGSLAMGGLDQANNGAGDNGPANTFSGSAAIRIDGKDSAANALGTVYACGAQNRIPVGMNDGKVTLPDSSRYTVSGTVGVRGAEIPDVEGQGSARTTVTYSGSGSQAVRTFQDISSLSVDSGSLALTAGSRFRDEMTLSVRSGAKLDLTQQAGNQLDIGSFDGDGYLILGQNQTLNIRGPVGGTSKVAIGNTNFDNTQSAALPVSGHTYIQAPQSSDGNFQLLPYGSQPNMTLVRDGSGNWTASNGDAGSTVNRVTSFRIVPEKVAITLAEDAEIPMAAEFESQVLPMLDFIPLQISLNGKDLPSSENADGYYTYVSTLYGLEMTVNDDNLCVTPDRQYSAGTYTIQVTIPQKYNGAGRPLSDSVTLEITDGGTSPGPVSIPVPTANTGLRWTGAEQTGVNEGTGYTLTGHKGTNVGSYTATAALQSGFQWTDGSSASKTIPWRIAKASGPAAPVLSAKAPSAEAGTDGKITGTSALMEYAASPDFTGAKDCGAGETSGLAAGTYYVRVKETATHEPGMPAAITVPACGAPVVSAIAVKTPASKTEYQTGEALDVTGLSIEVTYSDGSSAVLPVTAAMVSGFQSAQAAESLQLTITYEGKTAFYTVRIIASGTPGAPKYQVSVNNSYAAASGAGFYEAGTNVTVRAGSYSGHSFASWSPSGVELANPSQPEVHFVMPANDVTLLAVWRAESGGSTPHRHAWSTAWSTSETHHWHDCSASGCPIADNSQKSGYAAHTAGNWITDRPASSTQSGSRHRACTVCGYILEQASIPATGGSSSGSDSSSSGQGSIVAGPPSFSGGASSSTEKHPDGSTTTTTRQATGTVTETTRRPDGSKTVVETRKDGTVITTETAADGSTAEVRAQPGGSTTAHVRLSAKAVSNAQGAPAALPLPALPVAQSGNTAVTIHTGSIRPVRIEIPLTGGGPGTVAVIAAPDGTETVVRTSIPTSGGIALTVSDGTLVYLRDNGKTFADTQGHWAADAVAFVTARELFSGRTASAFAPDAPMTRAMLVTVLARLDGVETSGGTTAYERGAAWAQARGVSDGSNLDGYVTREQLATILHRYAGCPAATNRELHFSDADAASGYAQEALRWAVETGILSGYADGSLLPGGRTTRAQTAAVLMRYVRYLNA